MMYKVQVERVSAIQELHLPARSPKITTFTVTQTPGELLLTRCRTWHHQRRYINSEKEAEDSQSEEGS
ncbi:hypothetical protein E2C01_006559 [Portunus trituberculatus]|uniref:Uncharacterized protein n=1 Tax=Portunus trituberculatus TaxID=210409 RepID=A0A5B7CWN9_PORTR|nr:hypothetical protein [Portunus trituberculatus]